MPSSVPARTDTALLVLRVIAGIIMLAHGSQKLFVFGFAGVAHSFAQMGIPAAGFMGPFIGIVEFAGGIGLILGLLTRLSALGLACDMAGAILLVHMKNGFFAPMGFEFPLSLLAAFAAVFFAGAGAWSIDGAIKRRRFASH